MCRCKPAALVFLGVLTAAVSAEDYPEYPGEGLEVGRSVWIANCEGCHAYGVAGAPLAGDAGVWEARIDQGKDVLYEHAVEGFFGPLGTMMPPRGGNDSLSDEEVQAAVDYMVRLVEPPSQ